MKRFLCYDTNDAASGKIDVDSRGMLKSTGSSAQADWNVTDSADPAFIKNKPFGMEKGAVIRSVSGLSWSSYNYQQYSYRTSTDIQNKFAPLSQITNTEAIRVEVDGVVYDKPQAYNNFTTNPTISNSHDDFGNITFNGYISGLNAGEDWDNRYQSVSGILQLNW